MVAVRRPISSFGRTTGSRFERSLSVICLADRTTALTGESAALARRYAPPTESRTATRMAPIRTAVKVSRVSVADSYERPASTRLSGFEGLGPYRILDLLAGYRIYGLIQNPPLTVSDDDEHAAQAQSLGLVRVETFTGLHGLSGGKGSIAGVFLYPRE